MNINVFGTTLQAAVFAGLFAEYGHQVYWCLNELETETQCTTQYQDNNVNQLIQKQIQKGFLKLQKFSELNFDHQVCFMSLASSEYERAKSIIQKIVQKPYQRPKLFINGSTFGLNGTKQLSELSDSTDCWAYLPDNIQEGNALNSVTQMQKIIFGIDQQRTAKLIQELFRPLFPAKHQYLFMPLLDAEFTKLSISGMLATRISYMNDLALVSEKLGIDISNVQQGLAADSRIGSSYLLPGAGFGGENFSHDILTLSNTVSGTGAKSRLLEQVWNINEQQKEILFRKLWNYFEGDLKGKKIAIWGASFKENTSSIQNASIHAMLNALWAQGVIVQLHDPEALEQIAKQYGGRPDLILFEDQYQATENADALCLMTAWKQYWSPDFGRLKQYMHHPLILDGRNIFDPEFVKAQGFAYQGVGRS
ncbi:nucleotide sugar dehydrogenase [Acinetobacter shaoyimingii]|uniref:UDP-glucose 6-dehydrogenase n=1 Tax=Acinetobacter shaoyimingii TaxID=2715164 RepID=A0A6G8RRM5_9GAMM|nr:nucleotide sugar dehydrogenase [Acinetobacter shaoyimingii]NHB56932.1 UDP-glucose/GDP-mannose dehydrogenase family protein [Acinetobacter shaoyimingii]QIO04554.1 UDP-glucose/GDP-mannose dehydrogenase family protein [Acinetobacter shaoyimingii]